MQTRHFLGLSIFQVLAQFRRGIFYVFLFIYLKEFLKTSNTQASLLSFFSMSANVIGQSLIWGRLSDRFQKRRSLIVFGELFASIGYVVVFFIHRYLTSSTMQAAFTLIIGFTVIELVWSSSNIGWSALIADLTTEAERSKIMGYLQFMGGIANIIGITCAGFLYKGGYGFWDGTLFYITAGIIVLSIGGLFLIPESYAALNHFDISIDEEHSRITAPVSTSPVSINSSPNVEPSTGSIKFKSVYFWFIVVLLIINVGGDSIGQITQLYVRLPDTFQADDMMISFFRNTASIAQIIGGLVIGFFSLRWGSERMYVIAVILLIGCTLILPFAPTIELFYLYFFFKGLSYVWITTTSYSIVSRIVPLELRGKYLAYYNATFFISWGMGGTLLAGPISDYLIIQGYPASYAYEITFFTAVVLVSIGFLIYVFFRPRNFAQFFKSKPISNSNPSESQTES